MLEIRKLTMKATLRITIKTVSAEEGQLLLYELCEKLKTDEKIEDYHFEIESGEDVITEMCLLSGGKVIA